MDPPYQPPGPQQAFPQAMPPPDEPPNYRRSPPSQLQLPAPRQLLHYADTYRQASSQSHPGHRSSSASLPAPHQLIVSPPAQPHHHQSHHHHQHQQQDHLPALNPNHASRRGVYANQGAVSPATDAQPAQLVLTPVSNVDAFEGYKYHSLSGPDRRPITPPPCVRLSMIDMTTGKEINYNEIDHATFVLNVDLWNADGTREVNLVRSSAAASSSAASSITSQGFDFHNSTEASHGMHVLPSGSDASYSRQRASQYQSESAAQASYNGGKRSQPPWNKLRVTDFTMVAIREQPRLPKEATVQRQGSYQERVSCFSLRFSFVNVGPRGGRVPLDGNPAKVVTGRALILASSYSEIFNVFSAKKFPGVCESTALSKTFAAQGIKIPIRKEANGKGDDEDGYGD
ncbi:hypothetical protein MY11210_009155 [Beauveria gryllotalpidicola]